MSFLLHHFLPLDFWSQKAAIFTFFSFSYFFPGIYLEFWCHCSLLIVFRLLVFLIMKGFRILSLSPELWIFMIMYLGVGLFFPPMPWALNDWRPFDLIAFSSERFLYKCFSDRILCCSFAFFIFWNFCFLLLCFYLFSESFLYLLNYYNGFFLFLLTFFHY